MNLSKQAMTLYAVTDRSWLNGLELVDQVEKILAAGITFLQLREKELSYEAFLATAIQLRRLAAQYGVPFVVNDNIQVAIESHADGVHVGQNEIHRWHDIRKELGANRILGISANSVESALHAQKCGADYLGVGAIFGTSTKKDAVDLTLEKLSEICKAVHLPVVAIGGICENNMLKLKGSGIDGVAVISAIFAKEDVTAGTKRLLSLSQQMLK